MEAVLDASQNVAAAYRYDPFGKLLNKTGSFEQPFGFSTKRYNQQVGMIGYQYRNYFPDIARWGTRDPLGEAGGMNLYAFVGNNPVNWVDPWGLQGDIHLGSGWTGRLDTFNTGGTALHEIHVFNNVGKEVGVFGPTGWINKHGFSGGPQNIPSNVYNRLNGVNVARLRKEGLLSEKGKLNIKSGKYMKNVGKVLGLLGLFITVLEAIDLAERSEESGKSLYQLYLEDMGVIFIDPFNGYPCTS